MRLQWRRQHPRSRLPARFRHPTTSTFAQDWRWIPPASHQKWQRRARSRPDMLSSGTPGGSQTETLQLVAIRHAGRGLAPHRPFLRSREMVPPDDVPRAEVTPIRLLSPLPTDGPAPNDSLRIPEVASQLSADEHLRLVKYNFGLANCDGHHRPREQPILR